MCSVINTAAAANAVVTLYNVPWHHPACTQRNCKSVPVALASCARKETKKRRKNVRICELIATFVLDHAVRAIGKRKGTNMFLACDDHLNSDTTVLRERDTAKTFVKNCEWARLCTRVSRVRIYLLRHSFCEVAQFEESERGKKERRGLGWHKKSFASGQQATWAWLHRVPGLLDVDLTCLPRFLYKRGCHTPGSWQLIFPCS